MHPKFLYVPLAIVWAVSCGQNIMSAGEENRPVDYVIIVTGGELLQGAFPDGHTFFITRTLHPLGLQCVGSVSVDDRMSAIERALQFATERAKLVIVTGGLGPTDNDITRETLSSYSGIPLREDDTLLEQMAQRFHTSPDQLRSNLRRQTQVPIQGTYLANPHGTAVGLIFESERAILVALPGPSRELEPMVQEQLIPYLSRHFGTHTPGCSLTLRFVGIGQSQVDQTLHDHVPLPPKLTILSQFQGGRVDFTFSLPDDTLENRRQLEQLKGKILQHLGDYVYADSNMPLESSILRQLAGNGCGITLVEVGSGGGLTAALLGEAQFDAPGTDGPVIARAYVASCFEELQDQLAPLPRPWNPGATPVEKTKLLAEAAAARTQCRWVLAIGEIQRDEMGQRYVDVVSQLRDGPVDHQRVWLRGSGSDSRSHLTTQLLDYLRHRLRQCAGTIQGP